MPILCIKILKRRVWRYSIASHCSKSYRSISISCINIWHLWTLSIPSIEHSSFKECWYRIAKV
nr:MAG TPA: hypothetical protein [Caudoviricetes sp.]